MERKRKKIAREKREEKPSEPLQQQPNLPLLIHLDILHHTASPFQRHTPRAAQLRSITPVLSPSSLLLQLPDPSPHPRKQHPHPMQLSLDLAVARHKVFLHAFQPSTIIITVSSRR